MEDMQAIKRNLFEKVHRRLTEEARRDLIGKGITTGNTERYDRVLSLWVNLQRAMQFRWSNEIRTDAQWPWEDQDARVCAAWDALTNPGNEQALEILSHQLPDGSQLEVVRKALQICRERSKDGSPK